MFMKKYLLIIFGFFLISNCSLNKVVKHHGVHFLDKKHNKLVINSSNKNEIISLLGPPSTTSTFDNDMWIYIERNTSSSRLTKLGKKKLLKNNVLVLEIDNKGILVEKIFLTKDDMQAIDFSKESIEMSLLKRSFVYDFLSSVRQKINDPLNKRGGGAPKN
jgi:outer membrane protein assembly factor BamE (lipoprotein component of BamABCDE complex)